MSKYCKTTDRVLKKIVIVLIKNTFKLVAFLWLKSGIKAAYEIIGWFIIQCHLRRETTIIFLVIWYTKVHDFILKGRIHF